MIGLLSCSCIWSSIFLWSSWVWFSNSRNVWWFLQGLLWCISQTDTKRKRIWGKAPALFIVSSFKSLVRNLLLNNFAFQWTCLHLASPCFVVCFVLFCFFSHSKQLANIWSWKTRCVKFGSGMLKQKLDNTNIKNKSGTWQVIDNIEKAPGSLKTSHFYFVFWPKCIHDTFTLQSLQSVFAWFSSWLSMTTKSSKRLACVSLLHHPCHMVIGIGSKN